MHRARHPVELDMIIEAGITVRHLSKNTAELDTGHTLLQGVVGGHLIEVPR